MIFSTAAAAVLFSAQPAITERSIAYEVDGVKMEGFMARPAGTATVPGVVVIHDWDGPNDYEFSRVRQIASELGYAAFALDVYGIDNRPKNLQDNARLAGSFYADRSLFRKRLAAGADVLKAQAGVDPSKIVVMGYCFGGAGTLELARTGYAMAGGVSFHGSLDTTLPAKAGDIKAPLAIHHASQDPVVPQPQLNALLDELNGAEVDFQVVVYNIKAHAFTNPQARDYSPSGDRRSWQHFRNFLKEVFGQGAP